MCTDEHHADLWATLHRLVAAVTHLENRIVDLETPDAGVSLSSRDQEPSATGTAAYQGG